MISPFRSPTLSHNPSRDSAAACDIPPASPAGPDWRIPIEDFYRVWKVFVICEGVSLWQPR
ncbi:hypothetical protein GCM10009838_33910 [Catenulispora subtropica]|uniref:Uncharacterized protein n=1 Tax=Catenulispora subtropica TaxID=450798 RepID=A0ABN2RML5_9ACTN